MFTFDCSPCIPPVYLGVVLFFQWNFITYQKKKKKKNSFVNNIVLVDETRSGVNVKIEIWWNALKSEILLLSKSKTEYMECKSSKSVNRARWRGCKIW